MVEMEPQDMGGAEPHRGPVTVPSARIRELEQELTSIRHELAARDEALAELAARLRAVERGGRASSDRRAVGAGIARGAAAPGRPRI